MTVAPTSVSPARRQRSSGWLFVGLAFLLGGLTVGLLYHFDVFGGSSKSTSTGSGVPATQARDLPSFTGVALEGSNNVAIRVGEKQAVVVRADRNLLDRVTTQVHSGKLVIGNTPGSFTTKSPMNVAVSVPTLDAVTLTGSGNIVVSGIKAEKLAVTLPGSGTIAGSGTASQLDAAVSGSGSLQFTGLVASDAHAVVSGSGSVFITATKSLTASVSGSGSILYGGNPEQVTKSVTGSGAIVGG